MIFDPTTKELFTNAGDLIKKLHCPLRKEWEQLRGKDASPHRSCSECERPVLNTAIMSESAVVATVRADSSTCLCVSAFQSNVTILQVSAVKESKSCDHETGQGLQSY